jgi:hypothetical protein
MDHPHNETANNAAHPEHAGEHELKETLTVDCWYPEHPPRTESALFARTKHHLIKVLNLPCWACGSMEHREVHHYILEWAYAEAVDFEKVKADYPAFDWASFKKPSDFIDHEFNMKVLCAPCHRGKGTGIHSEPFPIWAVRRYLRAGFKLY